jgi:GNAT superfamily N-acetyltransferase
MKDAMLTIEKPNLHDRADWERLFRGYIAFYQRVLSDDAYDHAWQQFQDATRLHALVARLDGRVVGITHFFIHPNTSGPDVCYLQDLFTDTTVRNQGIGRALIAAVKDWAAAQSCIRLYWMTHESNSTARQLYDRVAENRGFVRYQIEL